MKIFCLIILLFVANKINSQWLPLNNGIDYDGFVLYNDSTTNSLFVGGLFSHAGNISANKIAKWNGFSWDSLSSGAPYGASIRAITKYQNKLYSSSIFENLPIGQQNWLYLFNGLTWEASTKKLNDQVCNFKIYNNELYMVGFFSKIGNLNANLVVKYNGINFTQYSLPVVELQGYSVNTLEFFQNQMYVGGNFYDTVSGTNDLERWNGNAYESFGGNIITGGASWINSMCLFNNELYIAGSFSTTSGISSNNIIRWDGNQFLPLTSGLNYQAWNMHVFNNELYVCGDFTDAGGIVVNGIAKWDGINWSEVCPNFSFGSVGSIRDFTIINNDLYITGYFPTIDSQSINSIAKYHLTNSVENIFDNNKINISPNPTSNFISIEASEKIKSLKIFSSIGKLVENYSALNNQNTIDISSLSKGVYILKFELENGIAIRKLIKE